VDAARTRFWDTPAAWWSLGGGLLLAFEAYIFIAWFASKDFKRIPTGPTPLPSSMKIALVACCVSTLGLGLWLLWRFVFKPWRRERQLTVIGAFGLATCLMFWQDPLQNQLIPWFSYNHWLPNMGSWANQFPGILQPHAASLADPVYASMPGFVLLYFGGMLITKYVMERARVRNPNISTVKQLWLSIGVATVIMGCLELAWMRTGFYIYPHTVKSLTLFSGSYFQIPIYEFLIDGVTVAAMGWLVYFRNDKGETIAERGLSGLNLSQKKKGLMRFLAFTCLINVVFGAYNLVVQPLVMNGGGVPKAIQERSYFMGNYCGQGMDMACWDKSLPIPTIDSAKVNPNGLLVPGKYPIATSPPLKTKP
jgi:branched-subunit amino acid ABC-type transport system permease component